MAFNTEKEMVDTIKQSSYLKELSLNHDSIVMEEVKGLFGIPDIVVVKRDSKRKTTYAYEAKLTKWKRALTQAYRYKAFADKSYVIMDHDHIGPALSNKESFSKSNVGLISIDNSGRIYYHYQPYYEDPFSTHLKNKLNSMILSAKHQTSIDVTGYSNGDNNVDGPHMCAEHC